ncbi:MULTISPECIES: MFS transporter [unclassified Carboxylicivirga]|uniref:MFS transporter n=1 Tax=Carboxylicivirga TaxID=1628153 RepID=UPI003D3404B4
MASDKIKLKEKIGYALGDTSANIAWRAITSFLLVFYTDVFGISAVAAGVLLLITRLSDGVTDVIMGMIADRTNTKHGKFRPWILWSAVPFGILLVLTFSTPGFGPTGKLIYAYVTYILLTLVYTANNVPYSALMGVMTADQKERTSLSSFRFAGAYFGGIIAQGLLIYLVLFLGGGDESKGYQYSMYVLAGLLVVFLLVTFFTTRERVPAPKNQQSSVWHDLSDLIKNKPWLILLVVGFLFVTFNSIKQGITVIYFKRFVGNELLAASYMVVLLVVSMVAALVTTPLANYFGKKRLFIYVMLFSGITTGLIHLAGPQDTVLVFVLGSLAEFGAGIMPVLFFAMLGDSADYSEWKHNRRATGLIYSAGTFAMKFGGGVAGAIIGFVLGGYGYDGMNEQTIPAALPGIKLLMSWIPSIFMVLSVVAMIAYPLSSAKMKDIEKDLSVNREQEGEAPIKVTEGTGEVSALTV